MGPRGAGPHARWPHGRRGPRSVGGGPFWTLSLQHLCLPWRPHSSCLHTSRRGLYLHHLKSCSDYSLVLLMSLLGHSNVAHLQWRCPIFCPKCVLPTGVNRPALLPAPQARRSSWTPPIHSASSSSPAGPAGLTFTVSLRTTHVSLAACPHHHRWELDFTMAS